MIMTSTNVFILTIPGGMAELLSTSVDSVCWSWFIWTSPHAAHLRRLHSPDLQLPESTNSDKQDGPLHLPWAETLQFTYPCTVTLVQFLATTLLLQCVECIVPTRKIQQVFSDMPPRDDHSKLSAPLTWAHGTICSLKPAVFVAAEAVIGAQVLFHSPVEVYLLSRGMIMPMFWAVTTLLRDFEVTGLSVSGNKFTWSSMLLSVSAALANYRPGILNSKPGNWTVLASSLLTTLSFLSLQHAGQMRESSDTPTGVYQELRLLSDLHAGDTIDKKDQQTAAPRSRLRELKHISFFATVLLFPIVIWSGELGHIYRNCYFLDDRLFQVSVALGAVFRCILFMSTVLLIQETSANTALFWTIVADVAMLPLFRSWDLFPYQIFGLGVCFLAAGFFCWNNGGLSEAVGGNNRSMKSGERRRFSCRWAMLALACMSCLAFVVYAWKREEREVIPASFLLLAKSKTGYLGSRPHVNMHANLTLMLEHCRGKNLEYVRDFRRCLDYLDTKQDEYLFQPAKKAAQQSLTQPRSQTDDSPSPPQVSPRKPTSCAGPVIPYHIWWTGPPTWRIELFIKSYLFTQNLPCSILHIWINTDQDPLALTPWLEDARFQSLFQHLLTSGAILLKPWTLPSRVLLPASMNPLDAARNYPSPKPPNWKGEVRIADSVIRDAAGQLWLEFNPSSKRHQITHFTVASSDAARLVILHLHGGVYVDVDMLLLRDLRPLILPNIAFAERWGAHEMYNNALVFLPANSSISSYLLRGAVRMGLQFHFVALGRMMRKEGLWDAEGEIMMLENAFLDPATAGLWGLEEGQCTVPCVRDFGDVFAAKWMDGEWNGLGEGQKVRGVKEGGNNRTMESFFRGAWAYHIHNRVSGSLGCCCVVKELTRGSGV